MNTAKCLILLSLFYDVIPLSAQKRTIVATQSELNFKNIQ